MAQLWKIEYYKTSSGKFPVFDFIQGLPPKSKSKIINALDLLEEFGIRLKPPHSKKLAGTDLWELRILGGDNLRVFYVAVVSRTFLLLHAFQKKKQKTDRKEIKIAEDRLRDYKTRSN